MSDVIGLAYSTSGEATSRIVKQTSILVAVTTDLLTC